MASAAKRLPRVFGGSSVEGLDAIREMQAQLEHDADMEIWNDDVFWPADTSLRAILRKTRAVDFAIFAMTPDDMVKMRGEEFLAVRDNVTFELGAFYGRLGENRVFMVMPRGVGLHLPTDLLGITPVTYDGSKATWATRLGTAATKIRQRLRALGRFDPNIPPEREALIEPTQEEPA